MRRRQFLRNSLSVGLGSMLIPRWLHPLLARSDHLRDRGQNRILVILNLGGGNDGLNTVIPFEDDEYYNLRPTIAIPQNELLTITETLGLHPAMAPLMDLWNNENMAIIQNVGYDQQDLSHFRSTDIWRSGWSHLGISMEPKPTASEFLKNCLRFILIESLDISLAV